MTRPRLAPAARRGVAGLPLLGLLVLAAPGTASAAEGDQCSVAVLADSERLADARTRHNPPHERMHVAAAHELATGRGVDVAVIDSGVQPLPGVRRSGSARPVAGLSPDLLSGHGTLVAGLLAGPDGVAPGASVFDVRVFDTEAPDAGQGELGVTSDGIARGVRAVIAAHRQHRFGVVNISLSVGQDDPVLREAVADLVALDVVVVAAAGNASAPGASPGFAGTPGSDAEVYPADYPGVVAVSAVPPGQDDPRAYVVPNADTDVAAPTVAAVSTNVTGQRCVVGEVATSWAAAEVSGLVALLRERYPRETAEQVVARLLATTEGSGPAGSSRNPWTGAGVVQAHDALTRELEAGREGRVRASVAETRSGAQAPPPPAQVDLFGSSRALLLWSGLVAGALMALAFLVRPLLRR